MGVGPLALLNLLVLNPSFVFGHVSSGRAGHGLIGYGIVMYDPTCAQACRDIVAASSLDCTESSHDMDGAGMHMGSETTPECYATDSVFLQTVAFCVSTRCAGASVADLEHWWRLNIPGHNAVQPVPEKSYQQALAEISGDPTESLISGDPLYSVKLVSDDDYLGSFNGEYGFEQAEGTHERYG